MTRQTATVPVIQLPKPVVLLPGVVQRIPVSSDQPEVASVLATVYARAASKSPKGRIETIPIACVPTASPLLGPDGQLLIQNGERSGRSRDQKPGLFSWGAAARITGVEGRGTNEFSLLAEGVGRVRVQKIVSEQPCVEAVVAYYSDHGMYQGDCSYSRGAQN
jgi:ATP-dependent Lon protease